MNLRMGKHAGERRFRYRIRDFLESKGWMVMSFTSKSLFDMLLVRWGKPLFVEVKAKNTWYPEEQRERQRDSCEDNNLEAVLIEQSPTKGKIRVEVLGCNPDSALIHRLQKSLEQWLEH